jgi:hypothetical protein
MTDDYRGRNNRCRCNRFLRWGLSAIHTKRPWRPMGSRDVHNNRKELFTAANALSWRPTLGPKQYLSGTHLLEAEQTPAPSAAGSIRHIEKMHSPKRVSNRRPSGIVPRPQPFESQARPPLGTCDGCHARSETEADGPYMGRVASRRVECRSHAKRSTPLRGSVTRGN